MAFEWYVGKLKYYRERVTSNCVVRVYGACVLNRNGDYSMIQSFISRNASGKTLLLYNKARSLKRTVFLQI